MQARIEEVRLLVEKIHTQADETNSDEQALELYLKAIDMFNGISKQELTADDLRLLAKCSNGAGRCCKELKTSLSWYENAANILTDKIKPLTHADKRNLSMYQNNIGVTLFELGSQNINAIFWYKKALNTLVVDDDTKTSQDLRNIADYQDNISMAFMKPDNKIIWLNKAITTLNQLKEDLSQNDNYTLAKFHYSLAEVYFEKYAWPDAQKYLFQALNLIINITSKKNTHYEFIATIYNDLIYMENDQSFDYQLYSFAYDIVKNNEINDFFELLLKFYLTITKIPYSSNNYLHYALFQLLQLIETSVDQANFPSIEVKNYLANSEHRDWFRNVLTSMKDTLQKQLRLETLCTTPNLMLDIALKLTYQANIIKNLQEKNKQDTVKLMAIDDELTNMKKMVNHLENALDTLKEEMEQLKEETEKNDPLLPKNLTLFSKKHHKYIPDIKREKLYSLANKKGI